MEAQKQTKIKQQPVKHKADNDIIVEVFNSMDDAFMSKIYLEFEKTNSVRDIFAQAQIEDRKANLLLKKICC